MSPEAIERRLIQVSQARELGLSLRNAGRQIRDIESGDERDDSTREQARNVDRAGRGAPR